MSTINVNMIPMNINSSILRETVPVHIATLPNIKHATTLYTQDNLTNESLK